MKIESLIPHAIINNYLLAVNTTEEVTRAFWPEDAGWGENSIVINPKR